LVLVLGADVRKLKRIEIKGFKSIESADLELGDLNVVIGANGSGKSNLIGAFKLLERYASDRLSEYVGAKPSRFLHHGAKVTPEMSLKLVYEGQTHSLTLRAVQDKLISVKEQSQSSNKVASGRATASPDNVQGTKHSASRSSSGSRKPLKALASGFAVHHFSDTTDLSSMRQAVGLNDNRCLRSDAANLAGFLYWLQKKEPKCFQRIQECIRLMVPFFDRFDIVPHQYDSNSLVLEWWQKGADERFDVFYLSDGTLRFICLATLLLQPKLPSLILLDEPELGLHPFAIRILAEMLESASMRTQIIVATQSVTLLDNFAPDHVVVAENDGRKSTFTRLDSDRLASWLEDYSIGELWEKNVLGGRP
jgi:predicted ATPase